MRTIRSQLALWYAVALVATVLAFGAATSVVDRRAKYAELDHRLTAEADLAAALLSEAQLSAPLVEEVSPTLAGLRPTLVTRLDVIADYLVVVD